ncbi:ribonuclease Z, mitochondrial [Anabrus simplex]|uniref:ribonuclease Z, mitochondrial n=1 Tax=Anabrus simplex TaxID=316456 RepID=UPI0035A2B34A
MNLIVILSRCFNVSTVLLPHGREYSSESARNLKNLLVTMPKEMKHTAVLQQQRLKLKEKNQKYVPGTVTIKVLGSGAKGAPRSLYIFTDQSRYLFNCGEGTQRLAHEHRMKLSKLEHIFITHPSWENIGGLPGVALTIQDVGVPEITIHGPEGTNEIFAATRRFVILRDLSVRMANCEAGQFFEDNVLTVHYVHLTPDTQNNSEGTSRIDGASHEKSAHSPSRMSEESDDDVDYYAHERKKKRRRSGDREKKRFCQERTRKISLQDSPVSLCYICRLKPRPGALCLERCVEKRVPAGPLLGILKSGLDVTLDDGTVVRSADVRLPDDPGPVFIVVECPTVNYIDSLVSNPTFIQHQATTKVEEDAAHLVVHFTPPEVMEDARYRSWMEKFFPSTHHLVLNEQNTCMGSVAVHRIQHKLHLLHPDIFPLLQDNGIAVEETENGESEAAPILKEHVGGLQEQSDVVNERTCKLTTLNGVCDKHSRPDVFTDISLVRGKTFYSVHMRPKKMFDRKEELKLNLKEFVDETFRVDGFKEAFVELQKQLVTARKPVEPYPHLVFLGTGSCIPNKTRNTSAILLHTSEDSCTLLDCGEGTYGQLVRFYGPEKVDTVLCKLRAIYVSHLHADHHIGLIGILKGRRKALCNAVAQNIIPQEEMNRPVFLMAPKQIKSWLSLYHRCFEPILQDLELVANGDLDLMRDSSLPHGSGKLQLLEKLRMADISTVLVKHCPNAFGVAFKHQDGWKLTYSGDTMPCPELEILGKDSDVLIHEATMEDDLNGEARIKFHSTTSQAIEIGKRMNAKFILLTHFSQRYAKLPRLNENFTSNVGIAFDNMKVTFSELPLLPLLYPALKLMFAEHYEEMEQKAARRLMKQERERENKAIQSST